MQRAGQIKKDLTLEERLGETEEASMVLDKQIELEEDKQVYDRYNQMKLVNVKATMMKNPDDRSRKEVDYIVLYLR